MLSQPVLDKLRPMILTLRIIVIALATGVIAFGIFAAVQNADKAQTFGSKVNYMFLGLSAPIFVAGFIVPRILPKTATPQGGLAASESEEMQVVQQAFAALQISTIVGCALFEGAAFMNLVGYLLEAELVHLAVAGLALLCIVVHFPTSGRVVQRVDEQLQAPRDERQFGR
jgi:hypothetical protein